MPTRPIQGKCRRCGRELYLFQLVEAHDGRCPNCGHLLTPEYTSLLLDEAARADRLERELVASLRRLVGLPGNLEVIPHSVLRNLFEEVGWEEDVAGDRELVRQEVDELRRWLDRFMQLSDTEKEAHARGLTSGLRRLGQRLHGLGHRLEAQRAEATSDRDHASRAATVGELRHAASQLDTAADAISAGAGHRETAAALDAAHAAVGEPQRDDRRPAPSKP